MIKLKNIRLANGIIYADAISLDGGDQFYIEIDVKKRKVIAHNCKKEATDYWQTFHYLLDLYTFNKGKLPKESTIAWY